MIKKNNSLKVSSLLILNIFIILFIIIPTVFVVITGFCKSDDLGNISAVFTTKNFQKLISPIYLNVILNSVKIAFSTTFFTFLIAYPLAYIISGLNKKLQMFFLLLIVLPYWTNSLVRTYSFMVLLRADGFINKILMLLGVVDNPVQLLYTDGAVIVSMIYLFLPVMFLAVYSSIEKLDKNIIEASKDLGAGKFYTFVKIIFPLSLPGIVAGSVLVFTPCLGLFYISDLIGGGKTVLLGNVIRDQFTTTRNLPFGSALSVVMMIMAMLFISVYYKLSSRGDKIEQ